MKKICIIGLGNMGKAMWDILSKKGEYELIGCGKGDDVDVKVAGAEVVILAVKPQAFAELADGIKADLNGKLVISIMAGIGIQKMAEALGTEKIVRTLPNLALKVGQSLTLWKAGEGVLEEEKKVVKEILASFGEEMEVDSEDEIVLIGVVSGCGPGFLAYYAEKMADFLVSMGVDAMMAEKVARQTLIGTGEVVREGGWNLSELRQKVSSKGGLTEAGVRAMEDADMGGVFAKGGEAALKKNEELSGLTKNK